MTLFKITLLSIILGIAAGCSSPRQIPDREAFENAKAKIASSRIRKARGPDELAPGYEIKLSNNEDQNLNGKFRIEFEGRLNLPYHVKIDTLDLNRTQLQSKIIESYSKFFKSSPNIAMSVSDENYWIDVRGLVEKPGRFLIKSSTSLDEALALAGGLQKNATVRYVKIQQDKSTSTIKLSEYYSGSPQDAVPPWRGGDILFFQSERGDNLSPGEAEGGYVQILGEIRSPGEYRFVGDADFYYYFAKAGGSTEKADLRNIQIIRETADGKTLTPFGLNHPKDVIPIRSGDFIFVPADKPTTFERTVPIVAGLVGILNTVLLMFLVF